MKDENKKKCFQLIISFNASLIAISDFESRNKVLSNTLLSNY